MPEWYNHDEVKEYVELDTFVEFMRIVRRSYQPWEVELLKRLARVGMDVHESNYLDLD